MPFALPVLLLVSLCLSSISGNDLNTNASEATHTLVAPTSRPLHRNQPKTARNDQLLSLLASRRREIIQKRFRTHIKNIVDLSSGNTSLVVPKPTTSFPNATKTVNVHVNLSDLLLRNENEKNRTEELLNLSPSTESNVVNVSSPRNVQKRKNVEPSQVPENKTAKNMPIIRNILYRRKMSFLNRKLPIDLDQIGFENLDFNKNPEDLILDNEDSLQVEESSHDKLIYYDVKNNASKKSNNNFEDSSDEIKSMSMNNKTVHNNRKNFNNITTTTVKPKEENITESVKNLQNKTENKSQNKNTTRFMSPSLYSYFRPLDVPEEEMQPFLRFGEKLPNKQNSRNQSYFKPLNKEKVLEENIATVKNEEEIDENMDVSVLKPQIYENKIAKVNLPAQKVSVAREYFKIRMQNKKNITDSILPPPKVEKKTYNYRNITRNRGFRNATIFVQNKRSGVRHTINLKGNSSIANLKPGTTTELIQNSTTVTTAAPIVSTTKKWPETEILRNDKIIKLQNMQMNINANTTIKIPENQTETVAITLPESRTTEKTNDNRNRTTTETSPIFTKTPETIRTTNITTTTTQQPKLTIRTTQPSKLTTRTTQQPKPTTRTTESTTTTTERITTTTEKTTTLTTTTTTELSSTPSTTLQTKAPQTTESTTTTPSTGIFSTAVVTSVSIESAKSRAANKTETEQTKNEQSKIEQIRTTTESNNLDLNATVIGALNNFTIQSFQNNNNTPLSLSVRKPFILRPTTTEAPTTSSEFIINVPDVETSTIPEFTTESPELDSVNITSRFSAESMEKKVLNISTTTQSSIAQTTIPPKRIFNTTVLIKPESESELPLATLFSVTEFKKPEPSQNVTKMYKPSGSETVISRKSESDVSIDNVHAAYILAALGFLPMMVIVIYVVRSVMKKKHKIIEDYEAEMHDSDKKIIIHPVARLPTLVLDPSNRWEFPRSKLRLQTLLGQGNFGQVWKAEADDLKGHVGLTRLVAVKTIKDGVGPKERDDLLKELAIMQKMGSHPNVVTLLGCCTDKEPYLLIMEYVMYGKLLTFLRDHRTRRDYYNFSDDAATLTARDLTVFAYCVARGMEYLSLKGIIHRDLAARNILVDHNKLCKIADFGMSRDASGTGGEVTEPRAPRNALPVRWMAVESLLYSVFTHKTDVWAFGVLLWEIVTLGSSPYANMSGREVMRLVCAGYRLERPGHCRPELYGVMARTWTADPGSRPTFAELRADLAALLEQPHPDGSYVDLESFRADPTVYEIDNCTPRGNYFTVKSRFSEFECDI